MKESEKFIKINGIDTLWDNMDKNFNLIQPSGSKTRTFCRCGTVFHKSVWRCPNCGGEGVYYNRYSGHDLEVPIVEMTVDGFKIVCDKIEIQENLTTNEYDVVKTRKPGVMVTKNSKGITFNFSSGYSYSSEVLNFIGKINIDFEDLKDLDSSYFTEFDKFNWVKFADACSYLATNRYYGYNYGSLKDNKTAMYLLFCTLKTLFNWLGRDGSYHEELLGHYLTNILDNVTAASKIVSLERFLESVGIPKEWKKYVDSSWFLPSNENTYYSGLGRAHDNALKLIHSSYQNFVLDTIDHYHFDYKTALNLCYNINRFVKDCKLEKKIDPVFEKYCKDNLVSYQDVVVEKFVNDSHDLRTRGMKVSADNLRELSIMKNKEQFDEMGYDKGRIDIFLDSFFDNPIKASYFLKSKKALTKKEMNDFIDSQTK